VACRDAGVVHFVITTVKAVLVVPAAALKHNVAFPQLAQEAQDRLSRNALVSLGKFEVEFDPELLSDVEDIGAHHVDVDTFYVLGFRQCVDILNHVVDVFHETHFDQCLVPQVKLVASLEGAHKKLPKEAHDADPHLEIDVLDTDLQVQ